MALAKDRIPHDSSMRSKVQTCVFDETAMKKTTSLTSSHGVNKCIKSMLEEENGSLSTNGLSNDSAISHSPPLCGNANGYIYKRTSYQLEEAESLINNLMQGSDSLLNFQQSWMAFSENNLHQGYYNHLNHISPGGTTDLRLVQDFSCFQTASAYSTIVSSAKEKQHGESSCGWLYSEESAAQESVLKKRSSMGENMQAAKKPCTTASKTAKPKSSQFKDPQSVAAKNRRERISERLKILQELIPNGSKVDLVTMLEKAISYVKFLQLQVKVLAADEFWPVQGGKPPDISQVRQAIDAILSSQR